MRNKIITMVILFQFVVLAFMAGEREYWFRTGTPVYLRTAPIDPRDMFRGDFVRLTYEISSIALKNVKEELQKTHHKGQKVYTVLQSAQSGLAEFKYCTDEKPGSGLFIRGRITDDWRRGSSERTINVNYGIEAYFVQQGKGIELERQRTTPEGVNTPLEIQVAVGSNGTAIIKNHRWSPLGIGLKILENPERNPESGRKSVKIRLILMNASDAPLAIVNLPDYRSFSLESTNTATKEWILAKAFQKVKPEDADVIVLKPNENFSVDIDLANERWLVKSDKLPVEIGTLEWSERFRLVYRPPGEEDCLNLEKKSIIWHGYLPSRAFHGRGNID